MTDRQYAGFVTVPEWDSTPHGRCGCGKFGRAHWTALSAGTGYRTYLVGCSPHALAAFDEMERTDREYYMHNYLEDD